MSFNTHYNRTRSEPEKNNGKSLVESAGYIPAKIRIENLILAGKRLSESRKEQYDFPDGNIDFSFSDPTRKKNLDLGEAFQMSLQVQNRLKNQADQAALLKASEPAPGPPKEA